MAGDDAGASVHENRIEETELHDTTRDLRNLGFGVCPQVPDIRNQSVEWLVLNVFGQGRRDLASGCQNFGFAMQFGAIVVFKLHSVEWEISRLPTQRHSNIVAASGHDGG
jgi:hypothetical protein